MVNNLLSIHAKSFSWAGFFLPSDVYKNGSDLYDFCRILDDIGQSRDSFAKNVVESVRKELDREDREAAAKKLANNYHKTFGTKPVTANVNPNLVGAV